jgi:hypothetical protein
MVKYEMIIVGTEDMVFTKTASNIVSVGSTQIDVGDHCVTFSGNSTLTSSDSNHLADLAGQLPDETSVEYQGEIVVGPTWRVVHQCSFIVAPGWYTNSNSDEDDWQGWGIRKDKWDLAPVGGGKKRIRLSFIIYQHGQNTSFTSIVYQATATGILETSLESPEIKPS